MIHLNGTYCTRLRKVSLDNFGEGNSFCARNPRLLTSCRFVNSRASEKASVYYTTFFNFWGEEGCFVTVSGPYQIHHI